MNRRREAEKQATLEQLQADIKEFGAIAVTTPALELQKTLGLGNKRARRLREWVLRHGSLNPTSNRTPDITPRKERSTGGEDWLVIGDIHVAPGQSYERLEWLGAMASELKVHRIIQGGDWNSFDSLCSARSELDRSKDRLADELKATELSLAAFHSRLSIDVPLHIVEGNHDARPDSLAKSDPWLEGVFDVWEHHRERGWQITPYLKPLKLEGVLFQHYLTGRGSNRAISGVYHAKRLLERVKYHESVVVFHSHRLQWWYERHSDRNVHGIVAGCYLDHYEEYAGMDNDEWWSGALVLRNVKNGDFDPEFWSLERIKSTFS